MKKILDEKGRLFGKINVIDLVLIVVIVLAVIAVGWKLAGDRLTSAVVGEKHIEYVVKCERVEQLLADGLALKDFPEKLMSSGSYTSGSVESYSCEPHMLSACGEDGEALSCAEEGYYDLYFTISASVAGNSITNQVGSQEVRVGKEHIVKTRFIELTGVVMSVEYLN